MASTDTSTLSTSSSINCERDTSHQFAPLPRGHPLTREHFGLGKLTLHDVHLAHDHVLFDLESFRPLFLTREAQAEAARAEL